MTAKTALALLLSLAASVGCYNLTGRTEVDAGDATSDTRADGDSTTDALDVADAPDTLDVADAADASDADVALDACALMTCGGACVDAQSDTHNCGACGHDCAALPNVAGASVRCEAGACVIPACDAAHGDCDRDVSNGCEADLSRAETCGACASRCAEPTPLCRALGATPTCASVCDATSTRCGMSCVNTGNDPSHCGGCDTACPSPTNGLAACAGGRCGVLCDANYHLCGSATCSDNGAVATCGARCDPCVTPTSATSTCDGTSCGFACNAGFADCDGDSANGCEVDTRASAASCGRCGNACATPPHSRAVCSAGACEFACDAGFHACGGACVDDSAVATCGARCAPCAAPAHAMATCAAGACGFRCDGGFADCDGDAANGCEVDLSRAETCGACATRCNEPTPLCSASGGAPTCASGCMGATTRCGMSCVNTANDPSNCGACSTACPSPTNGAAACATGRCGVVCDAGFHLCGALCVDDNAVATCGARCDACAVPANATAACASRTCGFSCNANFADCDGVAANGCEADTRVSVANCGRCGNACTAPAGATAACVTGSCQVICPTGQALCGATCQTVGATCMAGVGACRRSGVTACTGGVVACGAVPGATSTEVCDGVDNNCDGAVDELPAVGSCPMRANAMSTCGAGTCGFACNANFADCDADTATGCETDTRANLANCGRCGNACTAPTGSVASCVAGSCMVTVTCPTGQTLCGGSCQALGASCTVGVGACARTGGMVCTGGVAGCSATPGATSPEVCDNIDNNCDGLTDNGLVRSCYTGAAGTANVGACLPGTQTCSAGAWGSTCVGQVVPMSEVCDNADNDCNGVVDESLRRSCYTGAAGTASVGACHAGTQTCSAGTWGSTCPGQVTPTTENCNGLDDNCDGLIDELFLASPYNLRAACTRGVGICTRSGTNVCDSAGTGTTCSAVAGMAAAEVCDGLDNNCDGVIDDPFLPPRASRVPPQVLFYGPTLTGERPYLPAGSVVTIASDAMWRAMTAAQFASYDLIIIGEKDCSGALYSDLQAAHDTGATWGPQINGRVFVSGLDPVCHASYAPGAGTMLRNTLAWLSAGGGTALYVTGDYGRRDLDYLAPLGAFESRSRSDEPVNILLPAHPTMSGLTNAALTAWGNSFHSYLSTFPTTFTRILESDDSARQTLAVGRDPAGVTTGLGNTCIVGRGACARTGTYLCSSAGTGVTCSATAGTPSTELCDGVDNNCDGVTDETPAEASCPVRANAMATCSAATCGLLCASGFGNCDGSSVNGCEAILQTDPTNCGSCATVCASGARCLSGRCVVPRIIFVTSTRYTGNMGGLAGADDYCRVRAVAAGLPGTFKAWLSDSTTSAASRLTHSSTPYVLVTGEVVAANWTGLVSGALLHAINVDEIGGVGYAGSRECGTGSYNEVVWTGTWPTGETGDATANCGNWTSTATSAGAWFGGWNEAGTGWTELCTGSGGVCAWRASLYCVQQ